jgi:ADP-ribose pyrophosphatase YjhB (NUDIX family)
VSSEIRKVAAAVVSASGDRLLVVRKRGRDVYILPGGKPEGDESAEQTLRRELREELGVGATRLEPLMSVRDVAAFEEVALSMEVFTAVLDGEPSPSAEIAELAWVPGEHEQSGLRLATGVTRHVLPRLFPPSAAAGPVALLFSGGRDSTAVAVHLRQQGHPLRLLTFQSGLGTDEGLLALRLRELDRAWPTGAYSVHSSTVAGLVREICFRDLADDIRADGRQLILLGEAVAMLIEGVRYCLREHVGTLAMGASGYQAHYPEQQPESLRLFGDFCAEFDVRFITPAAQWASELYVKDQLRLVGLSAKSLESASTLADLDDFPPSEAVQAYLGRKLKVARALLHDGRGSS